MAELDSWTDAATRRAIVEFVERVTTEGGPDYVPPSERIATFDNDGTLWCEKPMQIEVGFILIRLAEMAEADASLRDKQPWKAAYTKDYQWLGDAIAKHYQGDESDVKILLAGMVQAFAGMRVDEYAAKADGFLRSGTPSDARQDVPRLRVSADDRADRVSGGERFHELHRLRR